jgi:hypothetical protein
MDLGGKSISNIAQNGEIFWVWVHSSTLQPHLDRNAKQAETTAVGGFVFAER